MKLVRTDEVGSPYIKIWTKDRFLQGREGRINDFAVSFKWEIDPADMPPPGQKASVQRVPQEGGPAQPVPNKDLTVDLKIKSS